MTRPPALVAMKRGVGHDSRALEGQNRENAPIIQVLDPSLDYRKPSHIFSKELTLVDRDPLEERDQGGFIRGVHRSENDLSREFSGISLKKNVHEGSLEHHVAQKFKSSSDRQRRSQEEIPGLFIAALPDERPVESGQVSQDA